MTYQSPGVHVGNQQGNENMAQKVNPLGGSEQTIGKQKMFCGAGKCAPVIAEYPSLHSNSGRSAQNSPNQHNGNTRISWKDPPKVSGVRPNGGSINPFQNVPLTGSGQLPRGRAIGGMQRVENNPFEGGMGGIVRNPSQKGMGGGHQVGINHPLIRGMGGEPQRGIQNLSRHAIGGRQPRGTNNLSQNSGICTNCGNLYGAILRVNRDRFSKEPSTPSILTSQTWRMSRKYSSETTEQKLAYTSKNSVKVATTIRNTIPIETTEKISRAPQNPKTSGIPAATIVLSTKN